MYLSQVLPPHHHQIRRRSSLQDRAGFWYYLGWLHLQSKQLWFVEKKSLNLSTRTKQKFRNIFHPDICVTKQTYKIFGYIFCEMDGEWFSDLVFWFYYSLLDFYFYLSESSANLETFLTHPIWNGAFLVFARAKLQHWSGSILPAEKNLTCQNIKR